MGASISQRPGKCLKNRRTKSEECLGSKSYLKYNMGRFFAPWHHFIRAENIANNNQETINATRYFTYSDWTQGKDRIAANMEKSFNEIHRTNSYDKNDYETDYEKLTTTTTTTSNNKLAAAAGDGKLNGSDDVDTVDGCCEQRPRGRLTIDMNKDSIFEITLSKGSRGLGFSILEYDGFVFIKQLFPLEAALQCGQLQEGDIILSANGKALTDLSSFEALQILRTLENPVTLIVCRLQQFLEKKPITSSHVFSNFGSLSRYNKADDIFEIDMKKINGSLGFTLRKGDDENCSHVVRALVKEPAISDGRINPGDHIISVNDQDIDKMTHQEAVKFLRDCGDEVKLKLRRGTISSSLTSLNSSQYESHNNNKTLRKEALDMLNDLAVKKLKADASTEDEQNNNESKKRNSSSFGSYESTSNGDLKRRDTLFNSRENLANLRYSDERISPHPLQDNLQMSNDLGKLGDEPVSLPALDIASDRISFRHNDPAYHSINVPNFTSKINAEDKFSQNRTSPVPLGKAANGGLLKWKGIVLDRESASSPTPSNEGSDSETQTTLTVELPKKWNSRLGFSLCGENGATIISGIYEDSIAAKDGRLRINDVLVEVNGKDIRNMETSEIIHMLRMVRGMVTITVTRNKNENS